MVIIIRIIKKTLKIPFLFPVPKNRTTLQFSLSVHRVWLQFDHTLAPVNSLHLQSGHSRCNPLRVRLSTVRFASSSPANQSRLSRHITCQRNMSAPPTLRTVTISFSEIKVSFLEFVFIGVTFFHWFLSERFKLSVRLRIKLVLIASRNRSRTGLLTFRWRSKRDSDPMGSGSYQFQR